MACFDRKRRLQDQEVLRPRHRVSPIVPVRSFFLTQCTRLISTEKIRRAVLQRLSKSTPDDNHACFLDSCIEATQEYEV